jgi:two-component system, NarL family, nitrate/nitrite response regulator NarL
MGGSFQEKRKSPLQNILSRATQLPAEIPWIGLITAMESIARQIRILILSNHAMFREGLKRLLDAEPDFSVVGSTSDGEEAVALVFGLKPDILLFDVSSTQPHPEDSGFQILRHLALKERNARPILLTASSDEGQIVEALKFGVRGVLRKEANAPLLFKCIRSVMEGGYWISRNTICELVKSFESLTAMLEHRSKLLDGRLSRRELQVIKEIVSGSSNRDIARRLSISEQTVKYHLTNIFGKTGMSSRMELARFVIRHQLVREA